MTRTAGSLCSITANDRTRKPIASGWNAGSEAVLGCSVVLTDWVVAEAGNGLARTSARVEFVETLRRFAANPRFRIVSVSRELRERALDLYAARPDKTWGLVDCASFIVMADEGITEAFTTDKHFEQAGFERLLPAEAA